MREKNDIQSFQIVSWKMFLNDGESYKRVAV